MWGLSEKRYEATFWGWGVMFHIWIGVGYISIHICQNPISSAFTICVFIIYKFYLKKNCNDTHTKLFRNEVYQIPLTWTVEEWIDRFVIK